MEEVERVVIKADEVDEPPPPPEAFAAATKELPSSPRKHASPEPLVAEISTDAQYNSISNLSARPPLTRDRTTPQSHGTWIDLQTTISTPPQQNNSSNINIIQPNPGLWNPPNGALGDPTDSLSLGQLRKIVQEIPKLEITPYAFEYSDTSSFEDEIEELFDYSWDERNSLLRARTTFCTAWDEFISQEASYVQEGWQKSHISLREKFLELIGARVSYGDDADKMESLECLVHVALGCWHETAGSDLSPSSASPEQNSPESVSSGGSDFRSHTAHVAAIRENMLLINQVIQPEVIFNTLSHAYDAQTTFGDEMQSDPNGLDTMPDIYQQRQRWLSTVLMYLLVDLARRQPESQLSKDLRSSLQPVQSKLLTFLTEIIAKSRWDDNDTMLPTKLLILYWKTILLMFGGLSDVEKIKDVLVDQKSGSLDTTSEPLITASPLDYHVFRQEIMSKYPAYNPPPALFPFEPDNNSFLPPLQDASTKHSILSSGVASAGPASIPGAGTSIMNEPVHIATPAPSPPPSPAGPGGKGLKKQNYQTNQLFPFLYPPLDASSNDLGGKGTTELQDIFAGRKWEGSDIPASILEAADLFSKRMRATRSMKQLWLERIRFMKHEQSYSGSVLGDSGKGSQKKIESREIEQKDADDGKSDDSKLLDQDLQNRLHLVEQFYKDSLPNFQSVFIVLLKTLVETITHLITQSDAIDGAVQINGHVDDYDGNGRAGPHPDTDGVNGNKEAKTDSTFNELANTRNQEISSKAVSGILILLLKWFKLSHVLKFEYISQLLLDSNYIQLVMKLFAHQELGRAVATKHERKDLNFFNFCAAKSRNAKYDEAEQHQKTDLEDSNYDDNDDAAPPPISLTRQQTNRSAIRLNAVGTEAAPTQAPTQPPPRPPAPEVDELGYPISALPAEPITNYSWRTFFTAINHLRILQKILKSKPHRQLMMVQGKYSNTLKKHLKVPQSQVRLYTLKIIKGQVPYCHRKWRQGNMRIITAIYLHVKPGLRDEWLSGLDVEQEVGEALPAEQALRALTYWYNLSQYPDSIGSGASYHENNSMVESDSGFSEERALSDLDLENEYVAGLEHENSPDYRDTDGTKDNSAQIPRSITLESSSAKMLSEQDFFLRELEKMDLGAALYGMTSSATSTSMSPVSVPGPSSPPPSTRMLPLPDALSSAAVSEAMQEFGTKELPRERSEEALNDQYENAERLQASSINLPTYQHDTNSITSYNTTTDITEASTNSAMASDQQYQRPPPSNETDIIVIAKETSSPESPRNPTALEQNPFERPRLGTINILQASTDDEEEEDETDAHHQGRADEDDEDADADDEDEDDAGMVTDADVQEGENMVLAQ